MLIKGMKQNEDLKKVMELLQSEKANEAKTLFEGIQTEQTVEYFFVKGILEQKFQNWGAAINAFSKVIEINPNHNEARNNLLVINNILNFWSPEMFNP